MPQIIITFLLSWKPVCVHAKCSYSLSLSLSLFPSPSPLSLTQLKYGVHGLNEPGVVRSKSLGQLCHLGDQVGTDILVPRLSQVGHQFLSDDHHVERVGHLVEQIQRLSTAGERNTLFVSGASPFSCCNRQINISVYRMLCISSQIQR